VKPTNATVLVIDDDAGVRLALESLIGSVGLRVECFASPEEFLRQRHTDSPSCLVLDVRLPGLSGLDLQRELARGRYRIPIIFITAHGDILMAVRAMKGGAVEFLPKPFRDQDLLDAIWHALDLDRAANVRRTELDRVQSRVALLTQRQRQIMAHMVAGKLNKQIAAELALSENTVKVHRRRIMQRMRAANFAELVHMIDLLGWNRGLRQSK
jgi:FixJ family two-component response regulator